MEITAFDRLSTTLDGVLKTFDTFYDKVMVEHNDRTVELSQTCYDLHAKFYEQMCDVSKVCNSSINSTKNIIEELQMVEAFQEFDINVHNEIKSSVNNISKTIRDYKVQNKKHNIEIVNTQDKIKGENKKVENNTPHFDFLKQVGWDILLIFESPKKNSVLTVMFGQFAVKAVASAVNSMFQLINLDKKKKMDRFNHILNELSLALQELLQVSFEFHTSLDCSLTNMEKYMQSVEKLSKYSSDKSNSEKNSKRILFMVGKMIPETQELQGDLYKIKEQALKNQQNLSKALIRINPRCLINNEEH